MYDITLRHDQNIPEDPAEYAGLKIPRAISVKNSEIRQRPSSLVPAFSSLERLAVLRTNRSVTTARRRRITLAEK